MTFIKKHLLTILILLSIFIISVFLRVYNLNSVPLGFHIDEASLGYNGYSLLLTGKDENNNSFPLYIDMFGDNRPSGYHYLTSIPIKLFGLNEFATRLPGALLGALMILPFFFLAQILFKNKTVSLISAFLLSIAPWSVVLSRASAETIVSLFFIVLGFSILIYGIKKAKSKFFYIGSFLLTASFFFYHTPRVFVPSLFLLILIYLYSSWNKFEKNIKINLIASFLLVSLASFLLVFVLKGGTGRFSQVSIFGSPGVNLILEEQIREDGQSGQPIFSTRAFHNKIVNYSLGVVSNYFQYFSGDFLFMQGGRPPWYKVPAMGLIYLVEFPFILAGIFYLLFSKDKFNKLPLIWLIIAPVTASFTVDDTPNLQRAIVMFPMLNIIAAYGAYIIFSKLKKIQYRNAFILAVSILLIYNFSYFLHQYFIQSRVHQNWYRYEGFDKMMSIVKENYSSSNAIVISKSFGGIYPLVLFYMQYNPSTYQAEGSPKDKAGGGFGKFVFASSECPSFNLDPKIQKKPNTIFIDSGICKDYKGLNLLNHSIITRQDGIRAFRIIYD